MVEVVVRLLLVYQRLNGYTQDVKRKCEPREGFGGGADPRARGRPTSASKNVVLHDEIER